MNKKYMLVILSTIMIFCLGSFITASEEIIKKEISYEAGKSSGLSMLSTDGTKIVNEKNEEVVLKGYNLGLWLSRSYWGLPIDSSHNTNSSERHSSVNNTQIYYELFTNKNNFTYDEVIELNNVFYENYITSDDMQTLKEIGANVVRLPFEWSFFMKPKFENGKVSWEDNDEYFEEKLDFLEKKVNQLGKKGIYVILDFHVAPGGQNAGGYRENPSFFADSEVGRKNRALALKIWGEIANRFKDNENVAGYDLINEPGAADFNTKIIPFYREAYNKIRKIGDEHIIIMETKFNNYNTSGNLPKPEDENWNNVVYSTHDYFWDREDADGDSETGDMTEKVAPPKEVLLERIEEHTNKSINNMKNYYNVPLYIGEFNHLDLKDKEDNDDVWGYALRLYNKNNVNYTAWTYKACWDPYMGMVYYGRKDIKYTKDGETYTIDLSKNRLDLQTASYDEIYAVFSASSSESMRLSKEFYGICEKYFNYIEDKSWNISASTSDDVQAVLSSDGVLTISGKGNMLNTWTTSSPAPWYSERDRIIKIKIEEGITNIGRLAFYGCEEVTKVELPHTLETIGHSAFFKCSRLTSIELKEKVKSISEDAFYKCTSLKNIYVYASNTNYAAVDGVLYNKDKTKIIKYPEGKTNDKYELSSAVTSVDNHAFYGTKLEEITIPKETTEIGKDAFVDSKDLTIMCKAGTKIEEYAIANKISYIAESEKPAGSEKPSGNKTPTKNETADKDENVEDGNAEDSSWENPFVDVNKNDWYYNAIKFAYQNNLFKGTSNDMFSPNSTMTRGMAVTVLYRLEGSKEEEESIFDDIDNTQYYASPVAWANKNKIVMGIGENKFAPNNDLTREQLVSILYRYAQHKGKEKKSEKNIDINSFEDYSEISEYAISAFEWGIEAGIITGRTATTLAPKGIVTRAEVATMMMRFVK